MVDMKKGVAGHRGIGRQCVVLLIYLGQRQEVNGSQMKENNQRLK